MSPWWARESLGATHPHLKRDQGRHGGSRGDAPSRMENGFLVATDNDMLDGALRLLLEMSCRHRDPVQPPLLGSWYCIVLPTHIIRSTLALVSSTLMPQVRRILLAARLAHVF